MIIILIVNVVLLIELKSDVVEAKIRFAAAADIARFVGSGSQTKRAEILILILISILILVSVSFSG